MGLNLLIGILVFLIVLILADGARRVWRERQGRLRLKIERRHVPAGDHDLNNPELPSGGARTIPRDAPRAETPEQAEQPPLVMESDDRVPAEPARPVQQNELFRDPDEAADEPLPPLSAVADDTGTDAAATREPENPPAGGEVLDVIVVHLIAPRGERFPGRDLLQHLLENGLRFGEMNIFHHHRQNELQYSMANAVEPGTFDIDEMENQAFAGVTFFLKLPGPSRPLEALENMLGVVRKVAEQLNGELKDEQRSVLTPQTMEHLRQRVQDFERRQRVAR